MGEQQEHLDRVGARIEAHINTFCGTIGVHGQFHMEDLLKYVLAKEPVAPDSPGRVLRNMRQRGLLDYEVINRRDSLYKLIGVSSSPKKRKG